MARDQPIPRLHTVVGIGASAGGLAALRQLFELVPAGNGLVFVVIMHLAPDQDSHMADLLQPHSAMPVRQVTESVALEPDNVYVIPPGRLLSAVDSYLQLSDLEPRRPRNPIDHFFKTLAVTHDGHAVGVVLSGTGSDGAAGLGAIREEGGLTVAQDPIEAEFDGMPRAALAAGHVDLVLPLAEIAIHLSGLTNDGSEGQLLPTGDDAVSDDIRAFLPPVLAHVKARIGHDLSGYKESTILRRLQRRMQLYQVDNAAAYLDRLRGDDDEIRLLFDDLLISVTSFFRDGEVFEELASETIPKLFDGKGAGDNVRVWSVGCATGEEVYSLAILLVEHAASIESPPHLQIFASDLHERSLQRARDGLYPSSIEESVSPERLRHHFVAENDGYRVRPELREIVVFAQHDLLRDPPFSHLDLVSCRNLLIYLRRDMQRSAISLFHYALEPGGHLVLGHSETLDRSDLFVAVDEQRCLFRRRDVPTREPPLPVFGSAGPLAPALTRPTAKQRAPEIGYEALHGRLVARSAPPSILVDAEHRIVHYSTEAGHYLLHPGGAPTNDIFRLVNEGLQLELRAAVYAARDERAPVSSRPIAISVDGVEQSIVLRVSPANDEALDGFVLIMFDGAGDAGAHRAVAGDGATAAAIGPVEMELDVTRRRLQAAVENYETGQEDIRAANEELLSANEELRSTMEELETSKEELQSMNEELATLNQENRHKVDELAMLTSDLQNLLAATNIATLFLDRQLRIVRFTPPISDIFNIVHSDRGRSVTDFTHRLHADDLTADAQQVLDRLVPIERELQSRDGRWLLTRLLPYRTADDRIEGVVITFIDITARLEAERSLRASERGLRLALDVSQMGAWSWDPLSGASTADERALDILGLRDGDDFFAGLESCLAPDDRPRLRQGLERDRGRAVMQLRASRRDDGRSIVIEINAGSGTGLPLGTADGAPQFIGTIQDITSRARILVERSERRAALATATTHLLHVNESSGELLAQLFDDMRAAFALASCHRFDRVGADQLTPASALGRTQESGQQPDPAMVASLSLLAAQQGVPVVRNELAAGQAGRAAPGWPITAYACYPLMAKGDVYAVLSFGTSQEHGFDDDDVDALRTLVDCLAMAEQYLQAEAEFRRFNEELEALVDARTRDVRELTANLTRAEQAERQRLAQMLHDDLQQLLHSAEMKLGLLRDDHLAGAHDSTIGYLDEVDVLLDGSVSLARRLTTDLSPQALDDNDLGEILAWLAVQMSDLHDLVVDLRLDDPIHLEDVPTRVILYQVIRELLFNVVKHADTDRASVTIEAGDSELVVEVSDDGSGFDTHALFAGRSNDGRGLHSVQQRLRLLGGELQIDSVPDGGTRVTVRCPPNSSSMLPGDG